MAALAQGYRECRQREQERRMSIPVDEIGGRCNITPLLALSEGMGRSERAGTCDREVVRS